MKFDKLYNLSGLDDYLPPEIMKTKNLTIIEF